MKIITILIALLLAGCASAPMAPVEQDQKAKAFTTSPDKSNLYIYRNESFGGAISMDVSINGKTIGHTGPKTYFMFTLPSGEYHVESKAENISSVDVNLLPGQNHFVWQEVKMGIISARSKLQIMDEATGRSGVLESKLIASAVAQEDIQTAAVTSATPTSDKLKELKDLLDNGQITQTEYDQAKAKILGGL